MDFRDEFEYTIDRRTFNVEVEGFIDENTYVISDIDVCDELGNVIDEDDVVYERIMEYAREERVYTIEEESRSFESIDMYLYE